MNGGRGGRGSKVIFHLMVGIEDFSRRSIRKRRYILL